MSLAINSLFIFKKKHPLGPVMATFRPRRTNLNESSKVHNYNNLQSSITICEKSIYLKPTPNWKLPWLDCRPSFASIERRVTSRLHLSNIAPSDPDPTRIVPPARQTGGEPPSPKCKLRIMTMVEIRVDSTTFRSPSDELGLLLRLILLKVRKLLSQASASFCPLLPAFRLPSTWPDSWSRNLIQRGTAPSPLGAGDFNVF